MVNLRFEELFLFFPVQLKRLAAVLGFSFLRVLVILFNGSMLGCFSSLKNLTPYGLKINEDDM